MHVPRQARQNGAPGAGRVRHATLKCLFLKFAHHWHGSCKTPAKPNDTGSLGATRESGANAGNRMKLVAATIRPFKLDEVRRAVADLGLQGVTVTEVLSYGGGVSHRELYRGAAYDIDFAARTRIELAVDDSIVEPVVEAIGNVARTARNASEQAGKDNGSDGRILVWELQQVIRVRTGETGPAAL